MDVLKEANLYGVQLYEEHKRFVSSFDDRWRSDETVMLLLSAIALFTPERPNVLHKDVVKLEQVRQSVPVADDICLSIRASFREEVGARCSIS